MPGFYGVCIFGCAIYIIAEGREKPAKTRPIIYTPAAGGERRRILFWDTDFDKIDWGKSRNFVIARVIERGNREEQEEIARFYGIRLSDFKKFKGNTMKGKCSNPL